MAAPTITFSPTSPQTVAPGAAVSLTAYTAPNYGTLFLNWDATPAANLSATLAAAILTHDATINFNAPTIPGVYTITATAFWNRSGAYLAPIPGDLINDGNTTDNVGGAVETNETWTNDASLDLEASVDMTDYFAATPNQFEGFYLVAKRVDNNDLYYLYVSYDTGVWSATPYQFVNGVTTQVGTVATLVAGDSVNLNIYQGNIEFYQSSNGTALQQWTGLGYEFRVGYTPFVSTMTSYPQPTIENPIGTAASVQTGTFLLTVNSPVLSGVDSMAAGSTTTLSNGGAGCGMPDGICWSTTGGSITQAGVLTAPCAAGPITVTFSSSPGFSSSKTIQVTEFPAIQVSGQYTNGYIGGQMQFTHAQAGGTWTASSGAITSEGLFTPNTSGSVTITYSIPGGCSTTLTVTVYEAMAVAEAPTEGNCLTVQRDAVQNFTLTNGSGSEIWTSTCPVSINSETGRFTAPSVPLECVVTVTDLMTGQSIEIPICVQGSSGTCIVPVEVQRLALTPETCAEYVVNCGDTIYLAVPGVGLTSTSKRLRASLPTWDTTTLLLRSDPYAQLTSQGPGAAAIGDSFTAADDMRLDIVVTPTMIQSRSITRWGFTEDLSNPNTNARWAIGVTADGLVGLYLDGALANTFGSAYVGQTLSIKFENGVVTLYRGGIALEPSIAAANCGTLALHASFSAANVTFGGAASPAWSIITTGDINSTGLIAQNGQFRAPNTAGLVQLQADVNDWLWRVNVRVVQPTPIRYDPRSIWSSGGAELWLNVGYYTYGQVPVLALDGSPDAYSNPYAINVGETMEGFKFKYERDQNEIVTDSGTTLITNGKEKAMMSGEMIEVRDTEKLQLLLSSATVRNLNGYKVVDFGGRNCLCEFSALLVKPNDYTCEDTVPQFDMVYLPRVIATSKGFEWNFKRGEITRLPFDLQALPDKTRPAGAQLFSVYFSQSANPQAAASGSCRIATR